MSSPSTSQRTNQLIETALTLVSRRADAEQSLDQRLAEEGQDLKRRQNKELQEFRSTFESKRNELQSEYQKARQDVLRRFQTEQSQIKEEHDRTLERIERTYRQQREEIVEGAEDARWEAAALHEGVRQDAEKTHRHLKIRTTELTKTARELHEEANATLAGYDLAWIAAEAEGGSEADEAEEGDDDSTSDKSKAQDDPNPDATLERIEERLKEARQQQDTFAALKAPKFAKANFLALVAVPLGFLLLAGLLVLTRNFVLAAAVGVLTPAVGAAIVAVVLGKKARVQVREIYLPLIATIRECHSTTRAIRQQSTAAYKAAIAKFEKEKSEAVQNAKSSYESRKASAQEKFERDRADAKERFPRMLKELQEKRDREIGELDAKYPPQIQAIDTKLKDESEAIHQRHEAELQAFRQKREAAWAKVVEEWSDGLRGLAEDSSAIRSLVTRYFPPWDDAAWENWEPLEELAPTVPFGHQTFDMSNMPGGPPQDERLKDFGPLALELPTLLEFPERPSVVIETKGEGGQEAETLLQLLMLRWLLAAPPSKVRFCIIDPVGLGRNFSAFMHLADHDEALVTNRIWTEGGHIEQRLTDLTDHMTNVIQTYLRNQFESIEQYNVEAEEIAEPYRVLVVVNFPTNFTDTAAQRLLSIASSGARCGVHVLMSVDHRQPMPAGFQLADLEAHTGITLVRTNGEFKWKDGYREKVPLVTDPMPSPIRTTQLLQKVGQEAKNAKRVEVPFPQVAPKQGEWWQESTAKVVDVPLGPSGARRFQHLVLGRGTGQHGLIAGKTGSGKSTLLHVMITNMALRYSPDELQLYLIDFKKGVEFKTYANFRLPHARVVAIESEREFGLSVLQNLDAEMGRRGDMYRSLDVQDVASYRKESGKPLPRILLMVDEFQEFFVEDDKIAAETGTLLDRLVRQGRAFGIHVMLGSQTLGGSNSLPRQVLGQMAIRIALQCSEADAHLILSEDNSAARLLSRPGEAIYNDANGLMEGNAHFQIVWLGDDVRDDYLKKLREYADEQNYQPAERPIVFEGNASADPNRNFLMEAVLNKTEWPAHGREVRAWLGEAIAIKDPTAAVFKRQGGSNLLIIGQHDEGAAGILQTTLVGLASQMSPSEGCFFLLDGSPPDAPWVGGLKHVAEMLPHAFTVGGRRDPETVVEPVYAEVVRRQQAKEENSPAIFLLIHDLGRFRDLRLAEDDFGFSSSDGPASLGDKLGEIVKEGPTVGVHAIIWVDGMTNANRHFRRQTMREFEMMALFQMSVTDSSTLIDTPAANKLGRNRGLYYSVEEGGLEKFRPYGLPEEGWLESVRNRLAARPQAAQVVLPVPAPVSSQPSEDESGGPPPPPDMFGGGFSFRPFDAEPGPAEGGDPGYDTGEPPSDEPT